MLPQIGACPLDQKLATSLSKTFLSGISSPQLRMNIDKFLAMIKFASLEIYRHRSCNKAIENGSRVQLPQSWKINKIGEGRTYHVIHARLHISTIVINQNPRCRIWGYFNFYRYSLRDALRGTCGEKVERRNDQA